MREGGVGFVFVGGRRGAKRNQKQPPARKTKQNENAPEPELVVVEEGLEAAVRALDQALQVGCAERFARLEDGGRGGEGEGDCWIEV